MEKLHRSALLKKGVRLEYFTVGYNVIEGFIAVAAGVVAGSIALVGFGLDSFIEVAAGTAVLWRLKRELKPRSGAAEAGHEAREKKALFIVGITFFVLALYILLEAGYNLITGHEAAESMPGIVLAAVSLVIMPALAFLKQRTGRALGSRALQADAVETWMCSYLSLVLLAGLVLNAALGWSWADPAAALAMLPLVIREGFEAIREAREE
ncbi:MAG: cation transporter [Thermoleophilia bacterium]|nr:cation transporter [Thermoleophilia bacterium]